MVESSGSSINGELLSSTALPFKPGSNASTSRTLVWQPMQVDAVSSPKLKLKLYKAMIEA